MEKRDHELILKIMDIDARLRRLYNAHQRYEEELLEFASKNYLTNHEQTREKQLKITKLKGVEKMMEIASEYQEAA